MSTAARRSRLSVARQRPAGIITDYLTVATKPNILNFLDFGLWPFADRLQFENSPGAAVASHSLYIRTSGPSLYRFRSHLPVAQPGHPLLATISRLPAPRPESA